MVPLERGTDGGAESLDLAEVDPTSEAGLQHEACFLHADQREGSTRLDLHGDVHVAATPRQRTRSKAAPQAGAAPPLFSAVSTLHLCCSLAQIGQLLVTTAVDQIAEAEHLICQSLG